MCELCYKTHCNYCQSEGFFSRARCDLRQFAQISANEAEFDENVREQIVSCILGNRGFYNLACTRLGEFDEVCKGDDDWSLG
jgi:hypothetical protein